MKNSVFVKFIAFALCALSLVAVAGAAVGITWAVDTELYSSTPEEWREESMFNQAFAIANSYAQLYQAEYESQCPEWVLQVLYNENFLFSFTGNWEIELTQDGAPLETSTVVAQPKVNRETALAYQCYIQAARPAVLQHEEEQMDTTEETMPTPEEMEAVPRDKTGETTQDGAEVLYTDWIFTQNEQGDYQSVELGYYEGQTYKATVYLDGDSVNLPFFAVVNLLYQMRYTLIGVIALGLLIFAATLVYLCCAAGRKAGSEEICPVGLNRIPLDLYGVCAGTGCLALVLLAWEIVMWVFNSEEDWILLSLAALCGYVAALLAIAFIFAFAAQVKLKGGYWWRHMILGSCLCLMGKFLGWIRKGTRRCAGGIRAVFSMMPLIWQWLLIAAVSGGVISITFLLTFRHSFYRVNGFFMLLLLVEILLWIAVVLYGGYCFGTLLKGVEHMAQGNLEYQIGEKNLAGAFQTFARELNSLAGAAQIAAERQMKSERMKTELITNVSHDIKTPLTSIINYVDLLKKEHTPAEGAQYLDVLDRQSQRLKKLIDDLMEMSKASTGNLTVELGPVDAVEAVNQALGEFADKLDSINLKPIFRYPEEPVVMQADGRLVWRVLSNLLNNAYKYAMPNTRLYIDLMVLQGNAVLSVKNISREQLNINAEELMERFVRGDTARNTEGSGLGLNIAKSLVELQHGQMHLMVDGDLFKATLIFPLL